MINYIYNFVNDVKRRENRKGKKAFYQFNKILRANIYQIIMYFSQFKFKKFTFLIKKKRGGRNQYNCIF